jgi:hypothetical protein
MDAQHHRLLSDHDATQQAQHEAALRGWRSGPFAEWQTAARAASTARKPIPDRPTQPAAPKLIQPAVLTAAVAHRVSVDDLVRHVRQTEVRTVYADGQLDAAASSLDADVVAAVKALDWPELPARVEEPPRAPLPEFHEMPAQPGPVAVAAEEPGEADPGGDHADEPEKGGQ